MSHVPLQSLQIQPDTADPLLAQQQTRFNTLVRDVALWRAALTDWKERIARFQQAVEPVRRELHAAWRRSETRRLEADFRAAAGVAPGSGLQSRRADRLVSSETQRLRSELLLLRRQTRAVAGRRGHEKLAAGGAEGLGCGQPMLSLNVL